MSRDSVYIAGPFGIANARHETTRLHTNTPTWLFNRATNPAFRSAGYQSNALPLADLLRDNPKLKELTVVGLPDIKDIGEFFQALEHHDYLQALRLPYLDLGDDSWDKFVLALENNLSLTALDFSHCVQNVESIWRKLAPVIHHKTQWVYIGLYYNTWSNLGDFNDELEKLETIAIYTPRHLLIDLRHCGIPEDYVESINEWSIQVDVADRVDVDDL
jgi:hypothetical protein